MIDVTISGNHATVSGGGLAASTDRVYVYGSTISSNTTGYAGAGVAAFYQTFELVGSSVSNNAFTDERYSTRYGAGLYLADGVTVRISDTTIDGNKSGSAELDNATHGGGIAGVGDGTEFDITGSVIPSNTADLCGGGLYVFDAGGTPAQMVNCTVTDNDAANGGGIYVVSSDLRLDNSIVADNSVTGSYLTTK